jgi:hypothetical protein
VQLGTDNVRAVAVDIHAPAASKTVEVDDAQTTATVTPVPDGTQKAKVLFVGVTKVTPLAGGAHVPDVKCVTANRTLGAGVQVKAIEPLTSKVEQTEQLTETGDTTVLVVNDVHAVPPISVTTPKQDVHTKRME